MVLAVPVNVGKAAEDIDAVALGHAADDADDEVRICCLALFQLAQARPDLLLGVLASGAGVVDDDVGLIAIVDQFVSLRAELPQDELAVEHVHLAAEGFQVQLSSTHQFPGPAILP